MHFHVVAHRLDDSGLQSVFVSSAGMSSDAVDVAADVFFGGIGPAEHHFDFGIPVIASDGEDLFVRRLAAGIGCDLFNVGQNSFGMMQFVSFPFLLIAEHDGQSAVDIGDIFKVLADGVGIELCAAEDFVIRAEKDGRAAAAKRAHFFDGPLGDSATKPLLPLKSVAMHDSDHF